MFIALELAANALMPYNTPRHFYMLETALHSLEHSPQGQAALRAAFPDGDDSFLARFDVALAADKRRRDAVWMKYPRVHPPPPEGHPWQYDAQSAFWGLLFTAARLRPKSVPRGTTDNLVKFNTFCEALLGHSVANPKAEDRRVNFLDPEQYETLFHPGYERLQILFGNMALYLSVPWHLYDVHPSHAHIALQRLIIGYFIDENTADIDIPLDTQRPRPTTAFESIVLSKSMSTQKRLTLSNSQPVSLLASGSSTASGNSLKRPAPDNATSAQDQLSKRPKISSSTRAATPEVGSDDDDADAPLGPIPLGGSPSGNDESNAHDDAHDRPPSVAEVHRSEESENTAGPPGVPDACLEGSVQQEGAVMYQEVVQHRPELQEYRHDAHLIRRDAYALRLKFWKDITYWLGSGK